MFQNAQDAKCWNMKQNLAVSEMNVLLFCYGMQLFSNNLQYRNRYQRSSPNISFIWTIRVYVKKKSNKNRTLNKQGTSKFLPLLCVCVGVGVGGVGGRCHPPWGYSLLYTQGILAVGSVDHMGAGDQTWVQGLCARYYLSSPRYYWFLLSSYIFVQIAIIMTT